MTRVAVQSWHRAHPPYSIGGSLYAVPPELRVPAARLLDADGCRVHADIILGPAGEQVGVTPAELIAVRAAVPSARIDLHLIVLAEGADSAAGEEQALETALVVAAEWVTLSAALVTRHHALLSALRAAGIRVWQEVTPSPVEDVSPLEGVDGVMVMLIEPGSRGVADLDRLDRLARLPPALLAGVDGGVTATIAPSCFQRGAVYVVSGRDLLSTIPTTTH